MPRGVYQRKGTIAKPRPDPAKIQATISAAESIDAFKQNVTAYHRQSLTVTCSAVICLVIGVHAREGIISQDDTIAKLRHAIMQRGVHDAQINKYIGVAKALTNWLINKYKVGGPVSDILNAQTAQLANDGLAAFLVKQKVSSLEDLTHLLGKYKRTPVKPVLASAPAPVMPSPTVGSAPAVPEPVVQAATEAVEQSPVASDIDTITELLRVTPTVMLVAMMERTGHRALEIVRFAAATMVDEEDINAAEVALVDRRMELYRQREGIPEKKDRAERGAQVAA